MMRIFANVTTLADACVIWFTGHSPNNTGQLAFFMQIIADYSTRWSYALCVQKTIVKTTIAGFLNHTMNCEPYAPMPMTPENMFVVVRNQTFINSTKKKKRRSFQVNLRSLFSLCPLHAQSKLHLFAF